MDAVLNCPHTIDHNDITLRFNPKQDGYNALAQLHHRLRAYDAVAKAIELELLAVVEDLERLIPLINQGGHAMTTDKELLELAANNPPALVGKNYPGWPHPSRPRWPRLCPDDARCSCLCRDNCSIKNQQLTNHTNQSNQP